MSRDALQDLYNETSARASQIARQLAIAGVAVVWLFSGAKGDAAELRFPLLLGWAGLAFVVSLGADLLHAIYRALAFGLLNWLRRKSEPSEEVDLPAAINWPSIFFFWLKLLSVCSGYLVLGWYLFDRVALT